ncbi:MAG: hypothetical protein WD069_02205, partial [Planctomycetales bacterium]
MPSDGGWRIEDGGRRAISFFRLLSSILDPLFFAGGIIPIEGVRVNPDPAGGAATGVRRTLRDFDEMVEGATG